MPYMAPELYMWGAGSHEADIWALGVTIYQLLAGKLPWGNSEISWMVEAKFDFPDHFDESTKEFISSCLTADPNKRLGWGEYDDLEEVVFAMDFFEGKIDTTSIHEQAPPIKPFIVYLVNQDIKEKDNKKPVNFKMNPEYHLKQTLKDGSIYTGQWLSKKRHGQGRMSKGIDSYKGQWEND